MTEKNITRIQLDGKELILIGTAHVSKRSAEEVKEVIEAEQPDSVCVELDNERYQAIMSGDRYKEMDIFKIIKQKKAGLLLINLLISSFQKRMAKQFAIKPGQEMIQGVQSANEIGANLILADRNIQVTFARIWHGIGFWGKIQLMAQIIASFFSDEEITEEELEKMKSQDMLDSMLEEFTQSFPKLKVPLIDERDQYLAQKIKEAPGEKVVAVLGAAHIPGIKKVIKEEHDLKALASMPRKSNLLKSIGWLIPLAVLGIIGYTFYANREVALEQTLTWVLWNGSLSGLGVLLAFGHPLTILTAFLVAPLSSLNPLLAAGWFAGFVEAYLRRPNVKDFEDLAQDVFTFRGLWKNKVTHILLVVIFANLGSTLGTLIGGTEVIRLFFRAIGG